MKEGPIDDVAAFFMGPPADVRMMMDNERYPAAVILMFAAMEALAQALRRSNRKTSPTRDFQDWVSRYLSIPGDSPTPEEWWLTRCAITHSYGVVTEKHLHDPKQGIVLWTRSNEKRSFRRKLQAGNLIIVNIHSMHEAFSVGTQTSLIDAAKDKTWWPSIEKRLNQFVQPTPMDPNGKIARLLYKGR